MKYSGTDIKKQKYQQLKFELVKNLMNRGQYVINNAVKDAENATSADHLHGILVVLFYSTGFRSGMSKHRNLSKNKDKTSTDLLSMGADNIQFMVLVLI